MTDHNRTYNLQLWKAVPKSNGAKEPSIFLLKGRAESSEKLKRATKQFVLDNVCWAWNSNEEFDAEDSFLYGSRTQIRQITLGAMPSSLSAYFENTYKPHGNHLYLAPSAIFVDLGKSGVLLEELERVATDSVDELVESLQKGKLPQRPRDSRVNEIDPIPNSYRDETTGYTFFKSECEKQRKGIALFDDRDSITESDKHVQKSKANHRYHPPTG